jgi:uncharacterized repeat protein (TIGR01451 family)
MRTTTAIPAIRAKTIRPPIGITLTPQVGIAKAATAATSNGDGTFSTDITLTVSNLGNEALNAVSVTDALATTAGGSFGTYSATAAGCGRRVHGRWPDAHAGLAARPHLHR